MRKKWGKYYNGKKRNLIIEFFFISDLEGCIYGKSYRGKILVNTVGIKTSLQNYLH